MLFIFFSCDQENTAQMFVNWVDILAKVTNAPSSFLHLSAVQIDADWRSVVWIKFSSTFVSIFSFAQSMIFSSYSHYVYLLLMFDVQIRFISISINTVRLPFSSSMNRTTLLCTVQLCVISMASFCVVVSCSRVALRTIEGESMVFFW